MNPFVISKRKRKARKKIDSEEKEKEENKKELILGFHPSIKNGWDGAVIYARSLGANVTQIFLTSKFINKPCNFAEKKVVAMMAREDDMPVFVHLPYTINFCKPELVDDGIGCILSHFRAMHRFGAVGGVLHMGRDTTGLGKEAAFDLMLESLKRTLAEVRDEGIKCSLILETCCGSGKSVFRDIRDLGRLYESFSDEEKDMISFCVDTCHIHAAGYDIRAADGCREFKREFDECIGWDKVTLIHLNDSKDTLASHKDNHETIGKGHIGLEGLIEFTRMARDDGIPLVLETPTKRSDTDFDEIAFIREKLNE